jgi:single-strand DNA-binding protein
VYVEGKLRTRKWQDKDGQDRYTTEIQADEMTLLDRPAGEAGPGAPMAARPAAQPMAAAPQHLSVPADEVDDLPF